MTFSSLFPVMLIILNSISYSRQPGGGGKPRFVVLCTCVFGRGTEGEQQQNCGEQGKPDSEALSKTFQPLWEHVGCVSIAGDFIQQFLFSLWLLNSDTCLSAPSLSFAF